MVNEQTKHFDDAERTKELEQERLLLIEINNILATEIESIKKISADSKLNPDTIKELKQENLLLDEITTQLEDKEVVLDDFFPNLSHQLKTHLVPIHIYLEMLISGKLGKLNPVQSQKLNIVKTNVLSLTKFITDILISLKMELGEFVLLKKNHDLGEIISESIDSMKLQTSNSKTKIIFKKIPMLIACDKQLILNVISNLIQNSLNAIVSDQGKIEIILSEKDNNACVEVIDNGKGISKVHILKIFDKFYKTERDLTHEGLGLGLYFSKQIIEIHGGGIAVKSNMGSGTTFYFTLPKN